MKLSICAITLDRFDISSEVIPDTLAKCGVGDVELLVCDNGSEDKRIIESIAKIPELTYHRINSQNEGVGRAFNQLMLRAKGEYIALIGNDILMQNGWAKDAIACLKRVPDSAISAIHCVEQLPPITMYGVHESDKVFGPWIFNRDLLEKIGFFHEGYFPYGLEDTDFCLRSYFSALKNFYVPNQSAKHIGHDVDENSEYRKMKNKSLEDNYQLLLRRTHLLINANAPTFEEAPPMRDPL